MSNNSNTNKASSKQDDAGHTDDADAVILSGEYSDTPCSTAEQLIYDQLIHSIELHNKYEYWANKFQNDNNKNWDIFYKRCETRFFNDRNYILDEYIDLTLVHTTTVNDGMWIENKKQQQYIFGEIGCGVGNTLLPLVEMDIAHFRYYGFDVSTRAIDIIRSNDIYIKYNELYNNNKILVWQDDISSPQYKYKQCELIDYATLIFVLSSLSMTQLHTALHNVYNSMSSHSYLYIRDYAIYDLAELRFNTNKTSKTIKLDTHTYVRRDGTRSTFFNLNELCVILHSIGFTVITSTYVKKTIRNRKLDSDMKRIFVQIRAKKVAT